MKSALKNNSDHVRRFTVGIVGASDSTIQSFSRIFTTTQYRNRYYVPVKLERSIIDLRSEIDLIIMCSSNPNVISAWDAQLKAKGRKMIVLSPPGREVKAEYEMALPVNPPKLIRMLDEYTIKELNFFPEFEIGPETSRLDGIAMTGIKLLLSNSNNGDKFEGRNGKNKPKCKALIVDDSLAVRTQMQIEFELMNVPLDMANSAESALSAVEKNTYNIIFLDVVMPGMDGYAACKKIKRSKLNRNTPIVLLTSKSSSFDKIKGSLAGCDAYMVKPINHVEFEHVYKKYVRDETRGLGNDSL